MIKTIFQKQYKTVFIFLHLFLFLSTSIFYAQAASSTYNLSKEVTTVEQLETMRVGVFGVSTNKEIIEKKNPKITNFFFFNTISDAIAGLKTNKIDCFSADVPVLILYANRNPDLKVSPLKIDTFDYGIALKKNSDLTEKVSKLLKRLNNKNLLALINFSIEIINGIPPVVLLMVLFYVIFGSIDISPLFVSILAFTLTFGATCYVLIGNGLQAVNIGQEEAAKALGFSEFQAFYKVVFPQAARQFLPLMKGQFMEMVKMTSVVGYIACIDLTKATDLIRSRTMEAFFPLIATALLYYIVAKLLIMALNKFEISLDPKRRERKLPGIVEENLSDEESEAA